MKFLNLILKLLAKPLYPIQTQVTFFVFMYALGVICAWTTLPPTQTAQLYDNLYLELFLDLYVIAVFLSLLPQRIGSWMRAICYVVAYATAIADVYCFTKFGSTLTPTMLLLIGETNGREAAEFLNTYLSVGIIFSRVGWILLLLLLHILFALRRYVPQRYLSRISIPLKHNLPYLQQAQPLLGTVVILILTAGIVTSAHNKAATWKLMTGRTIGEVEHTLTDKRHAELYQPIYRLAFSLYANSLAAQQIDRLIAAAKTAKVDSCAYTSPNIVLIIGESYSKHHSQQYGYAMPTTPRQKRREQTGLLVKYTDVVSPWNLTSFVFKHLFSMYCVGDAGEWCDYPLFPQLFRKAGYHVTFITNQFLPKAKEAVYDFSGGFFLNNPTLSQAQFDTRNDSVYDFDENLLAAYERLKPQNKQHNLIIFHLMGQHVSYKLRSPANRKKWWAADYKVLRPDLSKRQRQVLADYDNAVLYNDSVVNQIIKRFENEDAIVIYVPDHGEECYEGNRGFICRNHSAVIDYDLAKYEFEIPFWIWCSHRYAVRHPDIYRVVVQAKNRRFMTDALPHLLLYLAGIDSKHYQPANNLIAPEYNESRPRILKGQTDYDEVKKASEKILPSIGG